MTSASQYMVMEEAETEAPTHAARTGSTKLVGSLAFQNDATADPRATVTPGSDNEGDQHEFYGCFSVTQAQGGRHR